MRVPLLALLLLLRLICAAHSGGNGLVPHLKVKAFSKPSYFLLTHSILGLRQAPRTLTGCPLLTKPGAAHILPVARDGDLALSHFHWKTTASGYHRCQQGTRGVAALATMLLAAAPAAEVGETCFAFIFCLAMTCCSTILSTQDRTRTHFDSGSRHQLTGVKN